MKKSLPIHACWAIVAVIAFMVGSKKFTGQSHADPAGGAASTGARHADRPQESRDDSARAARTARRGGRASGDAGAEVGSGARLTSREITVLGDVLKTSRDPIERRLAFSKLLRGLTAENATLLREQIRHMSSHGSEWGEFHYAWGALAGEEAVLFAQESEERDMAACFGGWVSANPGAAMAWLEGQTDEQKRRGDLKWGAVFGLANTDPQLATEFVTERLQAGDRDAGKMIRLVADSVLKSGDHLEAAGWATRLPEGELRDAAVNRVARDYASKDPEKAVDWLETLPQSDGKVRGMAKAFSNWSAKDPAAAAERLNRMAESPARDSAVRGYSKSIVYRDTAAAIDWASTISDEKTRNDTLVRYGRIYMQRDREAATRWLANGNLPAGLQDRISAPRRRR